jgi:hypothetical protein
MDKPSYYPQLKEPVEDQNLLNHSDNVTDGSILSSARRKSLKVTTGDLIDSNPSFGSHNDAVSPFVATKEIGEPPSDKGNVVNIIFLLWGIGVLLPWNAVLTCFDFFGDEMPGYNPSFVYPFAVNALNAVA